MRTLEIAPAAGALLTSLRGFGYAPETALADLIDNSISAQASLIEVSIDWNDGDPRVGVLDDGTGMTFEKLEAAMRLGGDDPDIQRGPNDLGRFGLGMKTASLSQCQRLTVVSRSGGATTSMTWDVERVKAMRSWTIEVDSIPAQFQYISDVHDLPAGTLVALERMDQIGGLYGLDKEQFYAKIQDIRSHFAMVFHRFLNMDARRVRIKINGRDIEGWDPMLRTHPATQLLPSSKIGSGSQAVQVTPFVLPHRDRFGNETEFVAAGGPGGWAERQGFYVYRAKRLVVAGSWLGLGGHRDWTKDESSKLARIAVDLTQEVDLAWRIDVRKARARPPATLRRRLVAVGTNCRDRAREVFAWRGGHVRGTVVAQSGTPIWNEEHRSGKRRYRINRDHPIILALLEGDSKTRRLASSFISLVERSVPVERIWLDVSENVEATAEPEPQDGALVDDLVTAIESARSDLKKEEALDGLLRSLRLTSPAIRSAVLQKLGEHP